MTTGMYTSTECPVLSTESKKTQDSALITQYCWIQNTMNEHKLIAEYFKKCFFSVDGLWFVKLEEDASFEKALEIDIAVWKVIPKIQARAVKQLLGLNDGIADLQKAFTFKLTAEGYAHEIKPSSKKSFQIHVHDCPWVNHISKAGRKHLLQQIADAICPVEYETFSREFGKGICFTHEQKGCRKQQHCIFTFTENAEG